MTKKMWDYAQLTHQASQHGGPKKLLKHTQQKGVIKGGLGVGIILGILKAVDIVQNNRK